MGQKKLIEKYGKKKNMELLRMVLLIRRFEERAGQAMAFGRSVVSATSTSDRKRLRRER